MRRRQISQLFLERVSNRWIREFYFRYIRGSYMALARRLEPTIWRRQGVSVLGHSDATARIVTAIRDRKAFAAGRIGGIECRWLHWLLDGAPPTGSMEELRNNVGLFPHDVAIYRMFLDLYGERLAALDLLGLWSGKNEIRIYKEFGMSAAVCDMTPILLNVEEFAVGVDTSWLSALADRRVVVISSFAELIAERANESAWNAYWAGRVRWPRPARIESLSFPYGAEPATEAQYGDSLQLMATLERTWRNTIESADVVLAGCGGYALPLLAWAKSLGKTAIHLGSHVQVLFGIKGGRWDNRDGALGNLYNEHWVRPPRHLVPTNAGQVEGGCYW